MSLQQSARQVVSQRSLVERSELSPDRLIEHFATSVMALEKYIEEHDGALDWESTSLNIYPAPQPAVSPPRDSDNAYFEVRVNLL